MTLNSFFYLFRFSKEATKTFTYFWITGADCLVKDDDNEQEILESKCLISYINVLAMDDDDEEEEELESKCLILFIIVLAMDDDDNELKIANFSVSKSQESWRNKYLLPLRFDFGGKRQSRGLPLFTCDVYL